MKCVRLAVISMLLLVPVMAFAQEKKAEDIDEAIATRLLQCDSLQAKIDGMARLCARLDSLISTLSGYDATRLLDANRQIAELEKSLESQKTQISTFDDAIAEAKASLKKLNKYQQASGSMLDNLNAAVDEVERSRFSLMSTYVLDSLRNACDIFVADNTIQTEVLPRIGLLTEKMNSYLEAVRAVNSSYDSLAVAKGRASVKKLLAEARDEQIDELQDLKDKLEIYPDAYIYFGDFVKAARRKNIFVATPSEQTAFRNDNKIDIEYFFKVVPYTSEAFDRYWDAIVNKHAEDISTAEEFLKTK